MNSSQWARSCCARIWCVASCGTFHSFGNRCWTFPSMYYLMGLIFRWSGHSTVLSLLVTASCSLLCSFSKPPFGARPAAWAAVASPGGLRHVVWKCGGELWARQGTVVCTQILPCWRTSLLPGAVFRLEICPRCGVGLGEVRVTYPISKAECCPC